MPRHKYTPMYLGLLFIVFVQAVLARPYNTLSDDVPIPYSWKRTVGRLPNWNPCPETMSPEECFDTHLAMMIRLREKLRVEAANRGRTSMEKRSMNDVSRLCASSVDQLHCYDRYIAFYLKVLKRIDHGNN